MTIWDERDLPVLRALASSEDEQLRDGFLWLGKATDVLAIDLTPNETHDAILRLLDVGYVEAEVQPELFTQLRVRGRGQQALGEWPLFDAIASPEALYALLERFAGKASTEEQAGVFRRAGRYVISLSKTGVRTALVSATVRLAKMRLGLE
jgi:hypothetical protein